MLNIQPGQIAGKGGDGMALFQGLLNYLTANGSSRTKDYELHGLIPQ
jgi:hypothetical protein